MYTEIHSHIHTHINTQVRGRRERDIETCTYRQIQNHTNDLSITHTLSFKHTNVHAKTLTLTHTITQARGRRERVTNTDKYRHVHTVSIFQTL